MSNNTTKKTPPRTARKTDKLYGIGIADGKYAMIPDKLQGTDITWITHKGKVIYTMNTQVKSYFVPYKFGYDARTKTSYMTNLSGALSISDLKNELLRSTGGSIYGHLTAAAMDKSNESHQRSVAYYRLRPVSPIYVMQSLPQSLSEYIY